MYDKVPPDERYRAFLTRAADDAIAAGTEDEKGLHWTEQSDLMADGSYVFFFLYVYRRTGEQKYLDAALKVLAFAETKAVRSPVGGVYYKNLDLTLAGFDSSDTVFPNFTHGAAGTAYLNALVYEVTGGAAVPRSGQGGGEVPLRDRPG